LHIKAKFQIIGLVFLTLPLACSGQDLGEITSYTVFKTANYHQTNGTPPLALDAPDAYFFGVQYFADSTNLITNGVTFITPDDVTYSIPATNESFVAYNSDYFTAKAGMDAAFPDGLYLFSINQDTNYSDLTLPTNELYASAIPAYSGETWTNLQSLDPGQPLTLNWNDFTPNAAATSAFVFIRILDVEANKFVWSESFLPPATTTTLLPAATLNYGDYYRIELLFSTRSDVQNAGFGGAEATGGFDNLTYTYFTTIPLLLNIAPEGTNVVLSWTNSATNYFLQCTHDLATGNWNYLTNQRFVSGNQLVVTNGVGTQNTFFRLQTSP
jgi:hypothetical protein